MGYGGSLFARRAGVDLQRAFASPQNVVRVRSEERGMGESCGQEPSDESDRGVHVQVFVGFPLEKVIGGLIPSVLLERDRAETELAIRNHTATRLAENKEQTTACPQ